MRTYTNTATIYLSASAGNDGFSGRTATPDGFGGGPYRTFSRVMEAVNSMRCAGIMTPVTVKVMEDTELPSPIVIGQKAYASWYDKAIPVTDVTFESFGEKRVRLIGGKRLTGFKKDTFRGHDCLSVFLPEVKSGAWRFTDLYVDGKAARRTRFPKTGTLKAVTTEFPSKNQNFFTGSKWFIAEKDDLAGLEHVEDATVSFCHYWIDEHTAVESYDPKTGKLTMANRSWFMITTDYEHDGAVLEHNVFVTESAPVYGDCGIYPRPCFTAHDNTVFAAGNEPTFYQSKGCGIAPMSLADWQNAYGLDEGTTVKPLPEGFLAEIGTLDWREAKEQLLRLKTAR